jgi:hypothetical protein
MINPISQQNYYNIVNNAHNQFNPSPTFYNYFYQQFYEQNFKAYNDFNDIQQQKQQQQQQQQQQQLQLNEYQNLII